MNYQDEIDKAISLGINYLQQHQYPNGEFCAYISGDDPMKEWCRPDSTIFPAALISNSLLFLKEIPAVNEILKKSAAFLRYQMGRGSTWNHFTNLHPWRNLCCQDADDTACVSVFLKTMGINFPEKANKKLILANRNSKGLFYTWFTLRLRSNSNRTYWRLVLAELKHPLKSMVFWKKMECGRYDIDGVVNANILYYLGDTEDTQPIIKYLLQIILEEKEAHCDKWYLNPFTIYYFISKNYYAGILKLEPIREPVISRILTKAQPNGQLGETALDTALGIATLLNFNYKGSEMDKAVAFLLTRQNKNGDWERQRLYYGGPKKITGYGSEELTTAFCLEALYRYAKEHA